MVPDAVSFAIAMHAVRAAGGVPSPVDAGLCAVETAGQLAESGARMVITSPPLAEVALAAADRSWVRQVFSFADAAGTTRTFHVTRRAFYQPQEAPLQDIFGNRGGFYRNVITCAGDWIPSQQQTSLRLVVYASSG